MDFTLFKLITDQSIISFLMIILIGLFIWGRFRYDAVSSNNVVFICNVMVLFQQEKLFQD